MREGTRRPSVSLSLSFPRPSPMATPQHLLVSASGTTATTTSSAAPTNATASARPASSHRIRRRNSSLRWLHDDTAAAAAHTTQEVPVPICSYSSFSINPSPGAEALAATNPGCRSGKAISVEEGGESRVGSATELLNNTISSMQHRCSNTVACCASPSLPAMVESTSTTPLTTAANVAEVARSRGRSRAQSPLVWAAHSCSLCSSLSPAGRNESNHWHFQTPLNTQETSLQPFRMVSRENSSSSSSSNVNTDLLDSIPSGWSSSRQRLLTRPSSVSAVDALFFSYGNSHDHRSPPVVAINLNSISSSYVNGLSTPPLQRRSLPSAVTAVADAATGYAHGADATVGLNVAGADGGPVLQSGSEYYELLAVKSLLMKQALPSYSCPSLSQIAFARISPAAINGAAAAAGAARIGSMTSIICSNGSRDTPPTIMNISEFLSLLKDGAAMKLNGSSPTLSEKTCQEQPTSSLGLLAPRVGSESPPHRPLRFHSILTDIGGSPRWRRTPLWSPPQVSIDPSDTSPNADLPLQPQMHWSALQMPRSGRPEFYSISNGQMAISARGKLSPSISGSPRRRLESHCQKMPSGASAISVNSNICSFESAIAGELCSSLGNNMSSSTPSTTSNTGAPSIMTFKMPVEHRPCSEATEMEDLRCPATDTVYSKRTPIPLCHSTSPLMKRGSATKASIPWRRWRFRDRGVESDSSKCPLPLIPSKLHPRPTRKPPLPLPLPIPPLYNKSAKRPHEAAPAPFSRPSSSSSKQLHLSNTVKPTEDSHGAPSVSQSDSRMADSFVMLPLAPGINKSIHQRMSSRLSKYSSANTPKVDEQKNPAA